MTFVFSWYLQLQLIRNR